MDVITPQQTPDTHQELTPATKSVVSRIPRPGVLAILALLTLVRGVLYLAITPAWQGPDEPGHFEYVALLSALGHIPKPRPDTESIPALTVAINDAARSQRFEQFQRPIDIQRLDEQSPPVLAGPREAGYQTPIYYLMLLPFFTLVRSQTILVQYYTLALTSVGLGVITVVAAAMTVRTLLPANRWAQLAVPLLVSFWPNQSFMTTRINNDNMATVLGALVFWAAAVIIRYGPRRWATLALVGLLVLAANAKGTALFLLPVGVLAVALGVAGRSSERVRTVLIRFLLVLGTLVTIVALLALFVPRVAGILLSLAQRMPAASRGLSWIISVLQTFASGQQWQAARLAENGAESLYIIRSFWAVFGWGRYFLPQAWYFAAAAAAVIALAGWVKLLRPSARQAMGWGHAQWDTLAVMVVSIPLACIPLAARMVFDPFTTFWHGRSLLPILVPVAVVLVLGWYQWIPAGWRAHALQWFAAILVLLDAVSIALVLLPRFYQ